MTGAVARRPRQGFVGLWNISFGFFGIQIGFALQNANMSRIFQTLGESVDNLALLWIAAPVTGLLVQPIVGHYSDRTWGPLGRRRPYFLVGALLAAAALVGMPHAGSLFAAALMLWLLDGSLNVAMEPFRAFVGDMLDREQHVAGYTLQTAFIGAGAVVGSATPFVLDRLGVDNVAPPGTLPDTVRWSFQLGAAALVLAVGWTVVTTREYPPEELRGFATATQAPSHQAMPPLAIAHAPAWIAGGAAICLATHGLDGRKELYLLGGLLCAYGFARIVAARLGARGRGDALIVQIMGDVAAMPPIMRRLARVQFFTWSALFIMWIYSTPVVARHAFATADPASAAYGQASNWVGILFATYNATATLVAAFALRPAARRWGAVRTHAIALLCGAVGLAGVALIRDAAWLCVAEIGIGIAWASTLSLPYAILASHLPATKLGVYMGLFNIFVVLPQLLVATVMGTLMRYAFPDEPGWTLAIAAAVTAGAAAMTLGIGSRNTGQAQIAA